MATKSKNDKPKGKKKDKAAEKKTGDKCGGRMQGTHNFSPLEMATLVRLVGEHLPIGKHQWEKVAKAFQDEVGIEYDVRSLHSKYDSVPSSCYVLSAKCL